MTGKGEAAVVSYYQIAGREDENVPQYSREYYASEKPKAVLESPRVSKFFSKFFSKFLVHFTAFATSVAVVGVNFGTVYGWDQETRFLPDSQVVNLLQFAAKLHEILIVVSLTAIVMHHIRKRLVSSKGISFGLLSGGYQVSSLEFLVSRGFRGAFFKDGALILTLAAAILLGNVVGPSSAIVLIPRLNWWYVRAPLTHALQLYLDSPLDQLYPTRLGPPNMTLYHGCDTVEYTSDCPGAAFADLKNWAVSWYNNGMAPNISMSEATTNAQRALWTGTTQNLGNRWNLTEPNMNPNISITTTLTQPILELTGLFWDFIQVNSMENITYKRPKLVSADTTPIYSPVVQVQCAWFNYSEAIKSPGPDDPVVSLPLDVLDNSTGLRTSIAWPVHPSLWNFTRPMNATNFTWIDVSSYSNGDGPGASLGALITLPAIAVDGARRKDTFWDFSQQSWLIPCLVNAKWAAAKIQYEPRNSNQIIQNITDPATMRVGDGKNVTKASRQPWGLSETIHISPEWAALLNVAGIASAFASGESLNATMMEALLSQFVVRDKNPIYSPYMALNASFTTFAPPETSNVVPATIAAVVAEGLSRQAYNWTRPFIVLDEGPNNSSFTRLTKQKGWQKSALVVTNRSLAAFDAEISGFTLVDFTIERYGYGYGYRDSVTVAFGLSVLLTHAVVALAYMLYSIHHRLVGAGFTSNAWGEMGEMLALALQSERARELQNVGGGVVSKSTWKLRVRVRERAGDGLELVVGREDLDGALPQIGKKYR